VSEGLFLSSGGANDSLVCPFDGGFSLFFFLPGLEWAPPHAPDIFLQSFAILLVATVSYENSFKDIGQSQLKHCIRNILHLDSIVTSTESQQSILGHTSFHGSSQCIIMSHLQLLLEKFTWHLH